MSRVKRQSLPFYASPYPDWREGDFLETFAAGTTKTAAEALEKILPPPRWIQYLVRPSNFISARLGLPTFDPVTGPPTSKRSNFEIVFADQDRHIDYQITLLSTGSCLYVTTWVRPKTFLGTAYLVLARPLHNVAVTNALHRATR